MIRYLSLYLSVFSIILLTRCSSPSSFEAYLTAPECPHEGSITLQEETQLTIGLPDDAHFWPGVKFLYQDRYLLANSRNTPNLFHIYDMDEQEYRQKIVLDPNFMIEPAAVYVHNWDSIFFLGYNPMKLLLTDTTGEIKDQWDLRGADENPFTGGEMDYYTFFPTTQPFLQFTYDMSALYVTLSNIDHWFFEDKSIIKLHGRYSLRKREWELVYGEPQGVYATGLRVAYPFFLSHAQHLVIGDTAISCFPMDHRLFLYSTKNGEYLGEVCGASTYLGDLPSPYDYEKAEEDPQVSTDFLAGAGFYGKLQYHPKAGLISRYVLHPQPTNKPNGLLNSRFKKRTTSLVLFDLKLNKVGEYVFGEDSPYSGGGGGYHGITSGIATSDGFLVSRRKFLIKNEDRLSITAKKVFTQNNDSL